MELIRTIGAGTDLEAAPARRFEPIRAVLACQAQDAEAGAEALLGMWSAAQDHFDQGGGVGADGGGFALDALMGPAGVAAMSRRHVLWHGGVAAAQAAQQMAGDPLAPVEQLDRALGDARLDLLAQQAVRHRVIMAVDIDVVVESDAALAPLGVDVGLDRQSGERRPVELVEQLAATDAEPAHRPAVELAEQLHDGGIELGQREEALVAQAGQDPALDHLHADLDLGCHQLEERRQDDPGGAAGRRVRAARLDGQHHQACAS
jgi:hypothetical protein